MSKRFNISAATTAWIVCLSASLYFFYMIFQLSIFNALIHDVMKDFSLSPAEAGHLSGLYFTANFLFLFPAGLLLDRYSTRLIIVLAMVLSSVATLFFALTHSLLIASVCRFLVGTGAAFCFLSCIRLASRWFEPKKLALVTGVIVTMAMLGGMTAQTPFTILIQSVGWRDAMVVNAIVGAVITVVIWFTVKDYPPGEGHLGDRQPKGEHLGIFQSLALVMKNGQNWLCGAFTTFLNFPLYILGAIWGTAYLTQVHHLTPTQASYATSLLFVGTIFGSPAFGYLSDRMMRRKPPMIIGAILSLLTVLFLMYVPGLGLIPIIVLFFLLGFFTSAQVLSYPLIAEHNPMSVTSIAIGIASSSLMLSGWFGQPLFGRIIQRHWDHTLVDGVAVYSPQDLNAGMLIFPILFLVSLVLTAVIRESRYHTEERHNLTK